jgi:putative sporulation protein YtaF
MSALITIFQILLLTAALEIDAFAASFAYGSKKIKIPFTSTLIITTICSLVLVISLLMGTFLRQYIPESLTTAIGFIILFLIGVIKLLDSITKSIIKKHNRVFINKEIKFSIFNFRCILSLYANPINADIDGSKIISPSEAAVLAMALSIDSLAVGFGVAFSDLNIAMIFFVSLVAGVFAVLTGCLIGNNIANKTSVNISWVGGLILICLAIFKLF